MNRINHILLVLIMVLIYGCQVDPNPCNLSAEVLDDLRVLDSLINVPEIRERDRLLMKGNFDEPSLLDAQHETYRFIGGSSFGGLEIYRIEKIDDEVKALHKKFNYRDTVGVIMDLEFSIDDWNHLTSELKSKEYWTYPSTIDRLGLDGSTWSIRAFKPIKHECTLKNFHSVSRWSPIDTVFIEMCELFMDLKEK